MKMKLAFDLDDTLLRLATPFETEKRLFSHIFKKIRLRKGTYKLIKSLKKDNHKVWIYTRSKRSIFKIKLIFLLNGILLDGIVNSQRHHKKIEEIDSLYQDCYKYPPMFDLELLIDDGKFFYQDSIKYKFNMLLLDPSEENWVNIVRKNIEMHNTPQNDETH